MEYYEFTGYFNDESFKILQWSYYEFENGNRIKASKLKKCADKMEYKYRKYNHYPLKENVIEYPNGDVKFAKDISLVYFYCSKEV